MGRHGSGFAERHTRRIRRCVLLQPFDVLDDRIDGCWTVGITATFDRGTNRIATFHADAPFVDGLAVRNTLVAVTGHRQPSVGETPAKRGVLFAVVHVTIDFDAADFLDVVGEEICDVFVGRPVHRHAEIIAVFGFELGLDVGIGEPIVPEPI